MVKDFRISFSFRDNKKRVRLQRRLGAEGVIGLIDLWGYAAGNKTDGILSNMDDEDICIAANWQGEISDFINAITDERMNFLEKDTESGWYYLHDWIEHNPYVASSKQRSKLASKASKARWDKDKNAEFTQGQCGTHKSALRNSQNSNAPSPTPSPTPSPNSCAESELSDILTDEAQKPELMPGVEESSTNGKDKAVLLTFHCNGKVKTWDLDSKKVDEWQESFPGIDIPNECKKALQWIRDNPTKRKTARGMPKFLGGWLSRANDKYKPPGSSRMDKSFDEGVPPSRQPTKDDLKIAYGCN